MTRYEKNNHLFRTELSTLGRDLEEEFCMERKIPNNVGIWKDGRGSSVDQGAEGDVKETVKLA